MGWLRRIRYRVLLWMYEYCVKNGMGKKEEVLLEESKIFKTPDYPNFNPCNDYYSEYHPIIPLSTKNNFEVKPNTGTPTIECNSNNRKISQVS